MVVEEGHHDFLFTYHGKPMKRFLRSFRTACKNAGISYGENTPNGIIANDFRRSVKTNMVAAGIQKEYRDTILGHSLKGMDRHYIVPTREPLTEAMQQYTEWLDGQVGACLENGDQIGDQAAKNGLEMLAKSLKLFMPPAGIEPATPGLGILCSIH